MAFDIEAHRGGRALMPENTLASFANALSMGVDTLELDIGVTADGALVVSHERGLNPDLARGARWRLCRRARHSLRPPAACGDQKIRRRPDQAGQRLCKTVSRPARGAGHADPDLERGFRAGAQIRRRAMCASTSKPRSIPTIPTNPPTRSVLSPCCSISPPPRNSRTASWCSRSTGAPCCSCRSARPRSPRSISPCRRATRRRYR